MQPGKYCQKGYSPFARFGRWLLLPLMCNHIIELYCVFVSVCTIYMVT